MLRPKKISRLLTLALLAGGFALAGAADANAGIFGRSRVNSGGRGFAVRAGGPLTVRVSSAKYRRLKTFYPTLVRRVR